MKNCRIGIIILVLSAIILMVLPAYAAPVNVRFAPLLITADEAAFKLQIPADSYIHGYDTEIKVTDYSKIEPINEFYVTRSVDISMKDGNFSSAIRLLHPARLLFSFDGLDYQRASQMKPYLSVGHFRIGFWDETNKYWKQLPSLIFWDGSAGLAEAEAYGPGRYALLWSYEDNPLLSQTSDGRIRVMVNYIPISFDVDPYINSGRTMIPLRAVADNLNVVVKWNNNDKRVDLVNSKGTEVQLWIGKTEAIKDKNPLSIDAPPEIIEGRTFVPLRFVAEALGVNVTWDNFTRTAYLTTS